MKNRNDPFLSGKNINYPVGKACERYICGEYYGYYIQQNKRFYKNPCNKKIITGWACSNRDNFIRLSKICSQWLDTFKEDQQ